MKNRQPTILVVEDEPAIVDTIVYALETEGFSAVHASTCGEAKVRIESEPVDLIVLDVGLPDGDGYTFCRELRKTSEVPVIFLTARASEVDRVVGLEIGGDDYMVKPFSPRELTARIRAVLRRPAGRVSPPPPLETLPFLIDRNRRRIEYYGQPLELSRYEYELLALLIEKPGWVYTRDQLLGSVWDDDSASSDRTVDTHIKTLRAKLKAIQPSQQAILTHRGFGYSLEEKW